MASSNRQYKDSARFTFSGIIGIIVLIGLMLLSSCSVTKTTEKYDKEKKECCSKK